MSDTIAPSISDIPAQFAKRVKPPSAKDIREALSKQQEKLNSLLPIETDVKSAIEAEIRNLNLDLSSINLNTLYPSLDMSFMKMSKKVATKGGKVLLPAFAIFSTRDPICRLQATVVYECYCSSLTTSVDASTHMKAHADLNPLGVLATKMACGFLRCFPRTLSIILIAKFTGAIPDATKRKIAEATKQFDDIFIVAEAPSWELNTQKELPNKCPLVVGQKEDRFWLIDVFDPTPTATYVKSDPTVERP